MTDGGAGQGISGVPGVPGIMVGDVPGVPGLPGMVVVVPLGPGITMSGVPGVGGVPGITVSEVPGVAGIGRHMLADFVAPNFKGRERRTACATPFASSASGVCRIMSNWVPLSSNTSLRELTWTWTVADAACSGALSSTRV